MPIAPVRGPRSGDRTEDAPHVTRTEIVAGEVTDGE
jgi:hypothetical protein